MSSTNSAEIGDLTTVQGRQQAGLPEVVSIDWLKLPPQKKAALQEIYDVDFDSGSATGLQVGRVVSPWPLIAAPLAAVRARHRALAEKAAGLRQSVERIKGMPNLYSEAVQALDKAEAALLKSASRLPSTTARTQKAMEVIASHLYEAGLVARPSRAPAADAGPEAGM